MSLGALEATVVSTAMPTVIATLGGLAHYSWVFSAYLLTSTASVPIWGRLSDLYGRRRMYLLGVADLPGRLGLCRRRHEHVQLIAARAIQGLGAGAIIPLSMTIVGELYTLSERARTQALFSGVWGVASIAGPLVGGYITDALSWRWVFYLNLPVRVLLHGRDRARLSGIAPHAAGAGRLAGRGAALLRRQRAADRARRRHGRCRLRGLVRRSFCSAASSSSNGARPNRSCRSICFATPVIARTLVVVFLVGMALFGAIAFIPLFVQSVLGGTATQAGQVLTPLFLGWVVMSIVGARLTVRSATACRRSAAAC